MLLLFLVPIGPAGSLMHLRQVADKRGTTAREDGFDTWPANLIVPAIPDIRAVCCYKLPRIILLIHGPV